MRFCQTAGPGDLPDAADGDVGRGRMLAFDRVTDATAVVVPRFIGFDVRFDLHDSSHEGCIINPWEFIVQILQQKAQPRRVK